MGDSRQDNFYDLIDDQFADSRLPNEDDFERLFAEVAYQITELLKEHIRRCAYKSLKSGRFVPFDYGERSLVTAIRTFPDSCTYISISMNVGKDYDDFIVVLNAFHGMTPDDWMPEHDLPVDILGNTDGNLVFSAMLSPEAQTALLDEGEAKGWPKGWN